MNINRFNTSGYLMLSTITQNILGYESLCIHIFVAEEKYCHQNKSLPLSGHYIPKYHPSYNGSSCMQRFTNRFQNQNLFIGWYYGVDVRFSQCSWHIYIYIYELCHAFLVSNSMENVYFCPYLASFDYFLHFKLSWVLLCQLW